MWGAPDPTVPLPPSAHASTHAIAGADRVTPAAIGAANLVHTHVPADVTGTAVITTDPRLSDARPPTAHTHPESDVVGLVADLAAKEATANKGVISGYASLDGSGHVPASQLPTSSNRNGTPGTQIRSGTTLPPNSLGIEGDLYLLKTTGVLYKKCKGKYVAEIALALAPAPKKKTPPTLLHPFSQ